MIDWFASKMGLLVFIMVATAILMAFFFVQSDIYSSAQRANAATDIARLIESATEGVNISYPMDFAQRYNLSIRTNYLDLDGFVRYYFVNASWSDWSETGAKKLNITKIGSNVSVDKG